MHAMKCLQIYNHLNWRSLIDQMIPKLSGSCYAVRSLFHITSIYTLRHFISPVFTL